MTIQERIDVIARKCIVHSIIYYEMNKNIIPDFVYDNMMKKLAKLIDTNDISECDYCEVLKRFDSATGFNLPNDVKEFNGPDHLSYLRTIALNIVYGGK